MTHEDGQAISQVDVQVVSQEGKWSPSQLKLQAEFDPGGKFHRAVFFVILVNSITLGLQAWPEAMRHGGSFLIALDWCAVIVFLVEIGLRIYAWGFKGFFTKDAFNWFDFFVVLVSSIPPFREVSALRTLRIMRIMRIVEFNEDMKRVVKGFIASIPGFIAVFGILVVFLYVAAVMGTSLFRGVDRAHFGDLLATLVTLFQVMTFEDWPSITELVIDKMPLVARAYFVVFLVTVSFVIVNFFIAVIVDAIQKEVIDLAKKEVELAREVEKKVAGNFDQIVDGVQEEKVIDRHILEEIKRLRRDLQRAIDSDL